MVKVKKVRELESYAPGQIRWLLSDSEGAYYVASSIRSAFDTGQPETLVFAADKDGSQDNYHDICGGSHVSIDEAVAELEGYLNGANRSPRPRLYW